MVKVYQTGSVIPDDIDKGIAMERCSLLRECEGPRIGDFCIMPNGSFERFSYDWGESIQTSPGGSFYLGRGYASFSGSLNPAIPKERIKATPTYKEGEFWIFHHDDRCADNAVGVLTYCTVWRVI